MYVRTYVLCEWVWVVCWWWFFFIYFHSFSWSFQICKFRPLLLYTNCCYRCWNWHSSKSELVCRFQWLKIFFSFLPADFLFYVCCAVVGFFSSSSSSSSSYRIHPFFQFTRIPFSDGITCVRVGEIVDNNNDEKKNDNNITTMSETTATANSRLANQHTLST